MTLSELFGTMRTIRRFTQKPVPVEVLRDAVDAARLCASAANAQPLRYVVVTAPETVAALQPHVKWAGYLPPEDGVPQAGEQPTAFVAVVKAADANAWADIDVGLAVHQQNFAELNIKIRHLHTVFHHLTAFLCALYSRAGILSSVMVEKYRNGQNLPLHRSARVVS